MQCCTISTVNKIKTKLTQKCAPENCPYSNKKSGYVSIGFDTKWRKCASWKPLTYLNHYNSFENTKPWKVRLGEVKLCVFVTITDLNNNLFSTNNETNPELH